MENPNHFTPAATINNAMAAAYAQFTPAATINNAMAAAYGRSLCWIDAERDAFTSLLHAQLCELGAMPAATEPGVIAPPPGGE